MPNLPSYTDFEPGQPELSAEQMNTVFGEVRGLSALDIVGDGTVSRSAGAYLIDIPREAKGFWARVTAEENGRLSYTEVIAKVDKTNSLEWTDLEFGRKGTTKIDPGSVETGVSAVATGGKQVIRFSPGLAFIDEEQKSQRYWTHDHMAASFVSGGEVSWGKPKEFFPSGKPPVEYPQLVQVFGYGPKATRNGGLEVGLAWSPWDFANPVALLTGPTIAHNIDVGNLYTYNAGFLVRAFNNNLAKIAKEIDDQTKIGAKPDLSKFYNHPEAKTSYGFAVVLVADHSLPPSDSYPTAIVNTNGMLNISDRGELTPQVNLFPGNYDPVQVTSKTYGLGYTHMRPGSMHLHASKYFGTSPGTFGGGILSYSQPAQGLSPGSTFGATGSFTVTPLGLVAIGVPYNAASVPTTHWASLIARHRYAVCNASNPDQIHYGATRTMLPGEGGVFVGGILVDVSQTQPGQPPPTTPPSPPGIPPVPPPPPLPPPPTSPPPTLPPTGGLPLPPPPPPRIPLAPTRPGSTRPDDPSTFVNESILPPIRPR